MILLIEVEGVAPQVIAEHPKLLIGAIVIRGLVIPDGSETFEHIEPTRLTWVATTLLKLSGIQRLGERHERGLG
jgi:hypothetical protein